MAFDAFEASVFENLSGGAFFLTNKMKLDKELIKKVADNARLKLTDKEVDKFLPQFKEILDVFSKLNKVDTEKVKPSFQPIKVKNVFRDDVVEESLSEEEVFQNVKNKEKGYFRGPKAV